MYLRGSAMFQPAICRLQLALLSHSHSFPLLFLTGGKVLLKELSDWGLLGSFVLPWESGLTAKKKLRLIINISLTYNAQQALKEPAGRGKLTPMGGEASITSLWSYCHFNLWPQFNIWHTIRCSDYTLLRYKKQKWNKLLRFCWRRVSLCLSTVQFSFVTSWIYD